VPPQAHRALRPGTSDEREALNAEKYNPISVIIPGRHLLGGRPDDYTKVERVARSVVCLTGEPPSPGVLGLPVHWIPMWDTGELRHIPDGDAMRALLSPVQHLPRPVFWHCEQGINRSAFALAAYLILYRGQPIEGTIELIRQRRSPDLLLQQRSDGRPVCLTNQTMVHVLRSLG
jgi:hypothetical protein